MIRDDQEAARIRSCGPLHRLRVVIITYERKKKGWSNSSVLIYRSRQAQTSYCIMRSRNSDCEIEYGYTYNTINLPHSSCRSDYYHKILITL